MLLTIWKFRAIVGEISLLHYCDTFCIQTIHNICHRRWCLNKPMYKNYTAYTKSFLLFFSFIFPNILFKWSQIYNQIYNTLHMTSYICSWEKKYINKMLYSYIEKNVFTKTITKCHLGEKRFSLYMCPKK